MMSKYEYKERGIYYVQIHDGIFRGLEQYIRYDLSAKTI